jgi:hypothetical protein
MMLTVLATSSRHGTLARLTACVRTAPVARRALALALAATLLGAGGALAGNGAETIHFTAVYSSFTCAGERIDKVTPKAFTKDSETCTFTDLTEFSPGTYAIVPRTEPEGPGESHWASDYEYWTVGTSGPNCIPEWLIYGCIRTAVSGTIVVTDNGDGTGTLEVAAYYE